MAKAAATENTGTVDEVTGDAPRRRRARGTGGTRTPSKVFLFVMIDPNTGKPKIAKAFRKSDKAFDYFEQAQAEGSQLLVTTPE